MFAVNHTLLPSSLGHELHTKFPSPFQPHRITRRAGTHKEQGHKLRPKEPVSVFSF